jgi:hypothetical protein
MTHGPEAQARLEAVHLKPPPPPIKKLTKDVNKSRQKNDRPAAYISTSHLATFFVVFLSFERLLALGN